MTVELRELVKKIRNYPGLTRKEPIRDVFAYLVLDGLKGPQLPNYGDDAAAIPWRDGFLLLAADGIMSKLLINEPYAAGKSSVMVTVNDIYSMGGRPIAMVNVLASGIKEHREAVVRGIRRGCEKLRVPMVGGHLHPDAPGDAPSLSVAILGWANNLLRGHLAKSGDNIVFAADLQGQRGCTSVVSWDANSGKTPEELLHRLEVLPIIADKGLAHAAKDVSNAGVLGTISIMMENSYKGAVIDLTAIPCPKEIEPHDWFVCFQSFGFVLAVEPSKTKEVIDLFRQRSIDCSVVGRVTEERKVFLIKGGARELLFDFERDTITGISYHGE
ncbi:MAG: methanogenesis marker 2 protein [Deltaproteobacteria bacterium]|nr:methanogenesis marker 2 protein [Deltaproteobacteria bacterium]MBW1929512.1 methanogenesis marker 2 protein [Deltaproteobacteria bacterium]MBW2024072.1 methanogenesis marker 2 protein [Deltaproteobacteria bacterium]MBW2124423.1 methanogenesis marker 2 protein [Deltaproteobacteria bacterium]RLB24549.1 MAG: methanogenesis marker 2 protein [Deltaproteobacteria bacterium]